MADDERERARILRLFEDASSGEESSKDPFSDLDGEYGSDPNYDFEKDLDVASSGSDVQALPKRRRVRTLSSDSLTQSSDSECTELQDLTASETVSDSNQFIQIPSTNHLDDQVNYPVTTTNDEDRPVSLPSTSRINASASYLPSDNEWEDDVADIPNFDFDTTSVGIKIDISDRSSFIDIFRMVFPTHIMDNIVECTNKYGEKLCQQTRPHTRHSRKKYFKPTTREEIEKFLGICLLQGQISAPIKRKLFTQSDVLYYHPIFQYVMSGRRFEQILRCVCVSDTEAKGKDKVVNFISMLTEHFRKIYSPGINLSLDESLMLFRGRLVFRQYIKNKKARYGIKFYELTTDDGYVLNIHMYCGKDQDIESIEVDASKLEQTVFRLFGPYLYKGHNLYMDNYYNSVKLSKKLLNAKTHTNGTLRVNRKGNPKLVVTRKLKKGEHIWKRHGQVYVSKWQDQRPVLMITTRDHPHLTEVNNRYGQKKIKPVEVEVYNRHMSGIDRADQMIAYYSCPRKTIRWYKKVFFHMLDIAVWNSFYLAKQCSTATNKMSFLRFRDQLITQLFNLGPCSPKDLVTFKNTVNSTTPTTNYVPITQSSSTTQRVVNSQEHWPTVMKNTVLETNRKYMFLKCRLCTKKKTRKETRYMCSICKVPLCPECMEEWHNTSKSS